jgi:hypothetical protein
VSTELLEIVDLLFELAASVHWLRTLSISVGGIAGELAAAGDQEFMECSRPVCANEDRAGRSFFVMPLSTVSV